MLLSLVDRLMCPVCFAGARLQPHVFTEGAAGRVRNGILLCPECRSWYPIDEELLDLVVPALLDEEAVAGFCVRFASELAAMNLQAPAPRGLATDDLSAQRRQRDLFDWYAENDELDYTAYQNAPFWKAVDAVTFGRWRGMISPDRWLLDIGCANGRSALAVARGTSATVVGCDISRKLVRQAIQRARTEGVDSRTTFFVADGSRLPLRDGSFNYVLVYGVLHHLPDPHRTCRDALRVLDTGGIFFGSENNKSMFRKIFDVLMGVAPLWKEEAGSEPLISRGMIDDWIEGIPARVRSWTSVFLPPHLLNPCGEAGARLILTLTDAGCRLIPGLRNQGGLILFEMEKL